MENTLNESQNKIHALKEMLSKEMMVKLLMFSTVYFSQYQRFSAMLGDFISSFIVSYRMSTPCHLSKVNGFVFLLIMTSKYHCETSTKKQFSSIQITQ